MPAVERPRLGWIRAEGKVAAAALFALALALAVGACQRGERSGESAEPARQETPSGAPAPVTAASRWGVDTVLCDARVAGADGAGRDLTLTLFPGGSATLRTAHAGGSGEDLGWWSARHDTLALQLATKDGRASGTTATWRLEGAELWPLRWNREEWGADGVGFRLRGGEGGG